MVTLDPSTLLNGSGIDVKSLVSQVMANESGQTTLLQQRQSDLQTQATLLTGINNHLTSLYSAVTNLNDIMGPLTAMATQSSQPGILTATAQSSATAGSHTVVVNTLASQSTLYTNPVKDADTSILPSASSSADLKIQVGGAVRDIAISAGSNDTLNRVVTYINQQNWGVTATVLTDSTGARLAVYSNTTGSASALSVASNSTALAFNTPIGGADATFTVDGIPFSSSTNTASGAIPGVTLNLVAAYPGVQAQVAVGPDTAAAAQAITDFVTAYNTVVQDINTQFAVDPTTNTQGPLASDSALRALQSRILADATYSPGAGDYVNLRSLGITMNDDGTLSLNSSKLQQVLTDDPSSVLNFFQNSSQSGFANVFSTDMLKLTSPTLGLLSLELAQNRTEQQNLANRLTDLQDRLDAERQQLETQFAQVNAILQAFPSELAGLQLVLGISPTSSSSGK
jgi:flagellar hook-associated protein 2